MWLDLQKLSQISQGNWNLIYRLIIKLHYCTHYPVTPSIWLYSRRCQVCFHRWPFANSVKPWRSTIGPVGPVSGINKDVCDYKLLPTTASAYMLSNVFVSVTYILKTQHCYLCPCERYNLPPAAHLSPPPHTYHLWYYSSCEKVAQNSQC